MQVVLTVAALVPESGGPSRSVPALADALVRAGYGAQVVALDFQEQFSPPLRPREAQVGVTLVPCATRFSRATRYSRGFAQALRERLAGDKLSILHDNGVWLGTNYLAARVARATRRPFVISPRGMLTSWAIRHHSWGKRLAWHVYQRRTLAAATLLHATSAEEAEDLRTLGCRQPIAMIPNGVAFAPTDLPPTIAPMRRALFLSRVHPKKGLLDLIAVWSELKPPSWELVIAGDADGGHAAEVVAAIRAAGLEQSCHLVGPVGDDDKWASYAAADLFVLPSYSENFGLVIAEALGCGVPVITTTATPWTGVESHQCGWCVPPGRDALRPALAQALARTRDELQHMGARGRTWVRAEYSWGQAAEQLGQVYEFLVGQRARPATVQT